MQAIQTTFKGPTNTRGSKIIAKCDAGKIVVPYDHALSSEGNHKAAADQLRIKLGWVNSYYGDLVCGQIVNGDYVHVFHKA